MISFLKEEHAQDFATQPVPEGKGPRYKWLYLANIDNAVMLCVPVLVFGAALGASLSLSNFLTALVISGVFLALLSGWSSYIGVKTRRSTALLVETTFGKRGALFVWFFLALSLLGWFGVQTEMFSAAFCLLLKEIAPDINISPVVVTLVSGVIMSTTSILGIRAVGKLAQITVPVLFVIMSYALYVGLTSVASVDWTSTQTGAPMSLGVAIASIVGAYSVGVIVSPDIKRFAKDARHSVFSSFVSLGIVYPGLLFVAGFSALLFHQPDYMKLLLEVGLGAWVLLILMLATWSTNDMNLYSASLNLAPLLPNVSRPVLTAVAGGAGTLVAVFGVFEHLIAFFSILGILTTPLLVLYSYDYLTGRYEAGVVKDGLEKRALIIWLLSFLFGMMALPEGGFGLGLFELTTVPSLDSLIMACVLVCLRYATRHRFPARQSVG